MKSHHIICAFICASMIESCTPDPCVPDIITINEEMYALLPDNYYDTLFYRNDGSYDTLLAYLNGFYLDTADRGGDCDRHNPDYEAYNLSYTLDYPFSLINYYFDGYSSVQGVLKVRIGNTDHIGYCQNTFGISKDSLGQMADTLNLLGNKYYNVYHYNGAYPASCCTEIYYNKQYGVVGFKWLGEWYVLETDSL